MLPGFHAPRHAIIHIDDDGNGNLWHFFDQADQKVQISDRALTGVIISFWLKESQHDKSKNKPGIQRLKGYLKIKVTTDGLAYLYTVTAGLDTTFFRTLLISLADIPQKDIFKLMTLEIGSGSVDGSITSTLKQAATGYSYRGKVYGKGWEGLAYEALIWDTLNTFKSPVESYELLGIEPPQQVRQAPPTGSTRQQVVASTGLYPQHAAIANRFLELVEMRVKDAKFLLVNAFEGNRPDMLDPERFSLFLDQVTLKQYGHLFPTPHELLNSWRSKRAFYNGDNLAAIAAWTSTSLPKTPLPVAPESNQTTNSEEE